MREITVKLYQFEELNEKAKEKAREWFREGNDGQFEWDNIREDAKEVGLKITELNARGVNRGSILTSAPEVIETIMNNHGAKCDTYRTAAEFKGVFEDLEKLRDNDDPTFDDKWEDAEKKFLYAILEDYRVMLDKEYEYQNSDEVVDENIIANEYEFTEDGARA